MINSFPSIKRRLKPKQSPDAHDQATVQTDSFELKRNDKYYAWLFLGPSILALSVFVFYPMLRTLYLSFFLTNSLGEPTVFVGLQNYLNLLTTKSYLASLQATGIYVVGVTVFTLIGGLLLAAAANQRVRGIELFRTMFTSTMGVSVSVSAIFWLFMFNPSVAC